MKLRVTMLLWSFWAATLALLPFAESAEVDILMVYTDSVGQRYNGADGVISLAQGAVDSANLSFEDSGIDLKLRLVGVERTTMPESLHSLGEDLDRISEKDDFGDDILELRTEHSADLVCLLRLNDIDNVIGVAYLLTEAAGRKEIGFMVLDATSLSGANLLEHEVGHTLGAAHDRENASRQGLFSYSYGNRFKVGDSEYRTIMAYAPGQPISLFSNPNIEYEGVSTGVKVGARNESDNARTLNAAGPIVEKYYPKKPIRPLVSLRKEYWFVDTDRNGFEQVRVDPTLIFGGKGAHTWLWTWPGGSASGQVLNQTFPVGDTLITLEVTGEGGASSRYDVSVTVSEVSSVSQLVSGSDYSLVLMQRGGLHLLGDPQALFEGESLESNSDLFPIDTDVVFVESSKIDYVDAVLYAKEDGSLWGIGWVEEYAPSSADPGRSRLLLETGVKKAVLGQYFGLVVKTDGSLWGFGGNAYGQLGPLESFSQSQRFGDLKQSDVVDVAVARESSVFLKSDGSLWGMGKSFNYDSERNETSEVPVKLLDSGIVKISAGSGHFVALGADGRLFVSGMNYHKQLGLDGTDFVEGFQEVDGVLARDIYCYQSSTIVTLIDGSAVLWGHTRADPRNDVHEYSQVLYRGNVAATAIQGSDILALRDDGSIWRINLAHWTNPISGARRFHYDNKPFQVLPADGGSSMVAPVAVAGKDFSVESQQLGKFSSVALDGSDSYDDWSIQSWKWHWGDNTASGKKVEVFLPKGETVVRLVVTDDNGLTSEDEVAVRIHGMDTGEVVKVRGGDDLRLFMTENGYVGAAGRNWSYLFEGESNEARIHLPRYFDRSGDVADIEAGQGFFLILREDGSLWGDGNRHSGQLGPKAGNWNNFVPVEIFDSGVRRIEAGHSSSLVVMDDGSLWVAGRNFEGILGAGESEWLERQFVKVMESGVQFAKTGRACSLVVMEDGTLWGMGSRRRLGLYGSGSGTQYVPVQLPIQNVADVAIANSAYVLDSDETLWRIEDMGPKKVVDLLPDILKERFLSLMKRGVRQMEGSASGLYLLFNDGSLWRMNLSSHLWEDHLEVLYPAGVRDFSPGGQVVLEDGSIWGTGHDWNGNLIEDPEWGAEISGEYLDQDSSDFEGPLVPDIRSPIGVARNLHNGFGTVRLSGAFSRAPVRIESWKWTVDSRQYFGQNVELSLEEGTYDVALEVEGADGSKVSSSKLVQVVDDSQFKEWSKIYWSEGEIRDYGESIDKIDTDGDGLSALEEWRLGTDPTRFASRIVFAGEMDAEGLRLRLKTDVGLPGVEYRLISSDDGVVWTRDFEDSHWDSDLKWVEWRDLTPGRLYRIEAVSSFRK